ncbi:MAG: hypothetical protein VB111_04165 [Clostridiaceae bacterium]|nr:hypothetical protein [Clostridiaceae bacterium]
MKKYTQSSKRSTENILTYMIEYPLIKVGNRTLKADNPTNNGKGTCAQAITVQKEDMQNNYFI